MPAASIALSVLPIVMAAQVPAPISALAIAPDASWIFSGQTDGVIRAFDGEYRNTKWTVRSDPPEAIRHLSVSPDSKWLAAAAALQGTWRNVRLYNAHSGRMVRALGVGASAAFSPDSKAVAVAGPSGIVVLDLRTMQIEKRLDQLGLVLQVAFDSTGKRLAFTSGGRIMVVDRATWAPISSVPVPTTDAIQIGFGEGDTLVAVSAQAGRVYRWNLNFGAALPILQSRFVPATGAAISPDGKTVGFSGIQNEVQLFRLDSGQPSTAPRLGGGYPNTLALSNVGAAMGTLEGQVRWGRRPAERKPVVARSSGIAGAVMNAVARSRPDFMVATTLRGASVRMIQVDLTRPGVRVCVEVARGFPTGDEPFESLVKSSGAEIAITGTFFDTRSLRPIGDIVTQGNVLYRGHMGTALAFSPDMEPLMRRVPYGRTQDWSAFETVISCGPALVIEGQVDVDASGEGFRDPAIFGSVPRVGVGFTDDRRLLLVATSSLSFRGLAEVMRALGCAFAMNLDAGSSRALYYRGQFLIRPGRRLTNILTVDVP